MTTGATPILTISIPTYNRADFLEKNLFQLGRLCKNQMEDIEILISDNCSPDHTSLVVTKFNSSSFPIRYIKNEINIGSDANIAQCFNLAKGKYVLILGDDDFILSGILEQIIPILKGDIKTGVICMKPYGLQSDDLYEAPIDTQKTILTFNDAGKYLAHINKLITFISSNIINKSLLTDVDARNFMGENLVQVHLVIKAALRSEQNIFIDQFSLACTRNNSGGYDFSKVFVTNLGNILDIYESHGLARKSITQFENKLLFTYYPYYLLKQRLANSNQLEATNHNFKKRFNNRFLFVFWNLPIITLPKPFAIVWGSLATLIGRALGGELAKGLFLLKNKMKPRRTISA
jgi:glycosyltransferase involved in cell wall biosynthesis